MTSVTRTVVTHNVDELLDFPDSLCPNFPHFQGHKGTKFIPLYKRTGQTLNIFSQTFYEPTLEASASLICRRISPRRGAGTSEIL